MNNEGMRTICNDPPEWLKKRGVQSLRVTDGELDEVKIINNFFLFFADEICWELAKIGAIELPKGFKDPYEKE